MNATDEQRPFWLKHENDPSMYYAVGVESPVGALAMWLDPATGQNRITEFRSADDTVRQLRQRIGTHAPLVLVWDDRPIDEDIPYVEEDLVLTKARASVGRPECR